MPQFPKRFERAQRSARHAPTSACLLSVALTFLFCSRSAAQNAPVVGIRLSNASDCAEISDIEVVADGDADVAAIGVVGGRGRDEITNVGAMSVTSTAAASDSDVSATSTGITAEQDANGRGSSQTPGRQFRCPAPNPPAHGNNDEIYDTVTNEGSMTIAATATADDATAPITATSLARGIEGSPESDLLVNDGPLSVEATTTVSISDVDLIDAPGNAVGQVGRRVFPGNGRANGRPSGTVSPDVAGGAIAIGITGGAGSDVIENTSTIDATASTTVTMGTFDLGAADAGLELRTVASASSTGIAGDADADTITQAGAVTASATATFNAGEIAVALVRGIDGTWNTSSDARAHAFGVSAGVGDDTVNNEAETRAIAAATARAGTLNRGGVGMTETVTRARAIADATGVAGGEGRDTLVNAPGDGDPGAVPLISGQTTAIALSVGIGSSLAGITTVRDSTFDGGSQAAATAAGVDGGADDDLIDNAGTIEADADAGLFTEQANKTLVGITVTNADGTAGAEARSIVGGSGDDVIRNLGTARSDAFALAQSLDFAFSALGLSISPSSTRVDETGFGPFIDTRTTGLATSVGIEGGEGDDTIVNRGADSLVESRAGATTEVATITGTVSTVGGNVGRLLANTFSDSATTATAVATGISGDLGALARLTPPDTTAFVDGADSIRNEGLIDVDATSSASVLEANFGVAGETIPGLGVVIGVAIGKGGGFSNATGIGIDSGGDSDTVVNTGVIDVLGDADLPSFGLSLRITNGPSVGLDSTVASQALGIVTGAGDDRAVNRGTITALADSDATSLGLGVTGQGKVSGVSAALDVSSLAVGIDAGSGADTIVGGSDEPDSASSINATARAAGESIAAVVNLSQPDTGSDKPSLGLYTAVKTSADSAATAIGIQADGQTTETKTDPGLFGAPYSAGINFRIEEAAEFDSDTIRNFDPITTDARAVSVEVAGGGQRKGLTVAKTSGSADAVATAITAGGGDDIVRNAGMLTNDAVANVDGVAFSYTSVVGAAGAHSGGHDTAASATGIAADGDTLARTSDFEISAQAIQNTPGGEPAGVVAAIRATDTIATADGDDLIVNSATIDNDATAVTVVINAALASTGRSASSTRSSATASTVGIDAGGGTNIVRNSGELLNTAVANTDAVAGALTLESGLGTAISKGSDARATAFGILTHNEDAQVDRRLELIGSESVSPLLNLDGSGEIHSSEIRSGLSGDDLVINEADIDATARAVNIEAELSAVIAKGVAATLTDANASAEAAAIQTGGGSDLVRNTATLDATAFSNADAIPISVTTAGAAAALNKLLDGGTTATSRAAGIDLEGASERSSTIDAMASANYNPAADTLITFESSVRRELSMLEDSGDDFVRNTGNINATSRAFAASGSGAVSIRGVSGAITTSTADATATAVAAGGGNDEVRNFGQLDALAVGDATTINVTGAPTGVGLAANNVLAGGVVGAADAAGIRADGVIERRDSQEVSVALGPTSPSDPNDSLSSTIRFEHLERKSSGDDLVVSVGSNTATEAEIDITARSIVPSVAVAYSSIGVAAAVSTAESATSAAAIDTGGGDDTIRNSSWLAATSQSNADVINVSVSGSGIGLAADSIWDGGSNADAYARGIDADGRELEKTRTTTLSTTACQASTAACTSRRLSSIEHVTTESYAAGDDLVVNEGRIDTTALAVSPSIGVSYQLTGGLSAALTSATATADATAIDVGAGADVVRNFGDLFADSTSVAGEVSVAYTTAVVGIAANAFWKGGTQSNASAAGIGTDDFLSRTLTTTIDPSAADPFQFREEALEYDSGADLIVNDGDIDAEADAISAAIAVGVTPAGVAAAIATATTDAVAHGIMTERGADTIRNTGNITADAYGDATAVNVAVTPAGVALAGDASWDGGTTGKARAEAIDSGVASDVIRNSGTLTSNADARSRSLDVPVAIYGVGLGLGRSEAYGDAFGIYADDGDDLIVNSGTINDTVNANAVSLGAAVNIFGVAGTGNASWDGGIFAHADGAAIDAGTGNDTVRNTGVLTATSDSDAVSGQIGFTYGGLAAAVSTSTAGSNVDGIHLDAGDDLAVNEAGITASSDALAVTVNGTLGVFGGALSADATWDGGTTARASTDGIAGGSGNDRVRNEALVEADAKARATSVDVALSAIGVVASVSTSESYSRATGLAGDAGDDTLINNATVDVDSEARATHFAVDIAGLGAAGAVDSVWEGGTSAKADAFGLAGGTGADVLRNTGAVMATTLADTDSVGIAATAAGYAQSTVGSTAKADSTGLDGGEVDEIEDDRIVNSGTVTSEATADAGSVGVTFVAVGAALSDAFVDDATVAEARARGVRGGGGEDRIVLEQTSDVSASATANLKAKQVGIALTAGFASADVSSNAQAFATGIEAGVGDDRVFLDGLLSATATTIGFESGAAFNAIGAASPEVNSNVEANATGVSGGDGEDRIDSLAAMTVSANATNVGRTIAVTGTGANFGDAETSGTARAAGIGGDAGDDIIVNAAHDGVAPADAGVRVTATSNVTARSFGLAALGYTANRADATATSIATGVDGGSGRDRITNATELHATANATTTAIGRSVNLIGRGHTDAGTHATATATGIDGADDRSIIFNYGNMSASAAATTNVSGVAFTLAGASAFDEISSASATSVGIAGAGTRDSIYNEGTLAVSSAYTMNASGNSSAIIDFSGPGSDTTLTGTLRATGLSGRDGDDDLINNGTLTVGSTSTINADNSSWTVGGPSGISSGLTGNADLFGISGGAGRDWIENNGLLGVHATGSGMLDGTSWTFGGKSDDQAHVTNRIDATGIAGDDQADTITNNDTIDLTIANALSLNGGARTLFGQANGGGTLGLSAHGIGIDGGEGSDTITNLGALLLDTDSHLTTTSIASTFTGAATNTLEIAATATARAIVGGAGDDTLSSAGEIDASARAALTAGGGVGTRFGDAEADTTTTAIARATGFDAGDGRDDVTQSGVMNVRAEVALDGTVNAAGGGLFVDGTSRSTTSADVHAAGFVLGDGDDTATNDGPSSIAIGGSNTAAATSNGVGFGGVTGNATSNATATTQPAQARGFDGGAGIDTLINTSTLIVATTPATHSSAAADGSGLLEGNGIATADSSSNFTFAAGLIGGSDSDWIENSGALDVRAAPATSSAGLSDADGIDFFSAARSEANATIHADDVAAIGIDAGGGDNYIASAGTIDVVSAPQASLAQATADWRARNDASGNPVTLAVVSFATAGASANRATATGIAAGKGDDTITHSGALTISARPVASADAVARGAGWDGDAEAVATALANDALAIGIDAGDGTNVVENSGTIVATASPISSVRAEADPGLAETSDTIERTITELVPQRFGLLRRIVGFIAREVIVRITERVIDEGEAVEDTRVEADGARAIGIRTGVGNDRIVNTGSIEATVSGRTHDIQVRNGRDLNLELTTLGTAIDSGAGNDTVIFGHGASAIGHVELGAGDDTLELYGLSLIDGETRGGDGIDRIEFHGDGAFAGELLAFEQAHKLAAGVFQVNALPSMQLLQIDQGRLLIDADYQMPADGTFLTTIYGDGELGQLAASGTIGLDGQLIVNRDDGAFADGQRFEIVRAPSVEGEFADVALPDATALVSFGLEQDADSVDVVTNVEPFAIAATLEGDAVKTGMAAFFDTIGSDIEGPTADLIGALQTVEDTAALSDALTALSPSAYGNFAQIGLATARYGNANLRSRMSRLRGELDGERVGATAGELHVEPQLEARSGGLGIWAAFSGFSGQQSGQASGFGEFDFDTRWFEAGVDLTLTADWAIGARVADSRTNAVTAGGAAFGRTEGQHLGLFATRAFARGYAQAGLDFGRGDTEAARHIETGFASGGQLAEFASDYRAGFIELGRTLGGESMQSELFGLLSYVALTDAAVTETGMEATGFVLAARNASALSSELGWRAAWPIELGPGRLTPTFSVAWLRDLNVTAPDVVGQLLSQPGADVHLAGHTIARDGARFGLGLDYAANSNQSWSLRYTGERRGDYADAGIELRFRSRF